MLGEAHWLDDPLTVCKHKHPVRMVSHTLATAPLCRLTKPVFTRVSRLASEGQLNSGPAVRPAQHRRTSILERGLFMVVRDPVLNAASEMRGELQALT